MEARAGAPFFIRIFLLMLSPAILYWQDLVLVANEALNSDLSTHIIVIPFLLTYMVYRIRKTLAASATQNLTRHQWKGMLPLRETAGALMCLLAYLIRWHGSYTFQPLEYHIASLPLFVAGVTLIIFNLQTLRVLLFPILFLVFLLPPPSELSQQLGAILAVFSSQASFTILRSLGLPIQLSENYGSPIILLEQPSGTEIPFIIDVACSGLYSLIGFTVFALFTAYLALGSNLKKTAVFSLGFPLIYALNILRIVLLILIGYFMGPNEALNVFHILGGWVLILLGTLILLLVSEKALKIQIFRKAPRLCPLCKEPNTQSVCPSCGRIVGAYGIRMTKVDALKLTLIIIVSTSLLFIQVPVFALTQGSTSLLLRDQTGEETVKAVFPEIPEHNLEFVYRDTDFEKISKQDASLIYSYTPKNISEQIVWVGLEIGSSKGNLHPWEVCIITVPQSKGWQAKATQLDLRDIHVLDNPPLSARYFAYKMRSTNLTEVILYWYTKSIFKLEGGYAEKWVKISLIQYAESPSAFREVEDTLLPFAKEVANYWQPITTWSWVALAIAQKGTYLITTTASLIMTIILYSIYLEINKRRLARHTYSRITDPVDKSILESIKTLKTDQCNTEAIALKFKEITGKTLDEEQINLKLIRAEEAGLIFRRMTKINDEPYFMWKTIY